MIYLIKSILALKEAEKKNSSVAIKDGVYYSRANICNFISHH